MRRLVLAVALSTALAGATAAQPSDELRQRLERYEALYQQTRNASVLWLLAEGYAQAGDKPKALDALKRVADLRMGFMPVEDSAVQRFAGDPDYDALVGRMAAEQAPVRRAKVAFTLKTAGLVPEGLAYDAAGRRLFIGDGPSRTILAVDASGAERVFAGPLEAPPLGMTVDAKARRLWAASTNAFWDAAQKRSALIAFDLATGRPARTVTSPEALSFNDVALAPNGDLWATDSLGGQVFRLKAGAAALERVTPQGAMAYPNGIALSDDGRHVFVAQGASLRRIDAATGEVLALPQPDNLTTLGIDGLYWRNGALVAVQNGGTAGRVLRLKLSPARDAIAGFEVLEAGNPHFEIPTTGAPAGDRLYVLANAQLMRMRPDGSVDRAKLKPIVVLDVPLA
jgi:sugar lactone lactonase YvrE